MGYNIEKYKDRSELVEFTLKDDFIDNYTIRERFGISSFTKLDALFFTLYAYYEKQINDKKLRVLIDNLIVSERTYLTNEIYVFFGCLQPYSQPINGTGCQYRRAPQKARKYADEHAAGNESQR